MKIALLSDLHLSVSGLEFPERLDADVMVLAGDLGRPHRGIEWAKATRLPTLFVAGNHDFYGSDLVTSYQQIRELTVDTPIRLLERSELIQDGVRFLGCTLWTDYRLFDSPASRTLGIEQAVRLSHDFSRIRLAPDFEECFTPAVSQMLFLQSVQWLEDCFARPHDGPTVVVTHHAPALGSIAERFRSSPINASFVSDLTAHILRWRPVLWLHGHMHNSLDYRVGGTRIVCNPRGYVRGGVAENPAFDPRFTIEL